VFVDWANRPREGGSWNTCCSSATLRSLVVVPEISPRATEPFRSGWRLESVWRSRALGSLLTYTKESHMEFLLLICNDPTGEEYVPEEDNIVEWVEEVTSSGVRIQGNRLRPMEHAKTVRRRRGTLDVTDGPFADTKERIGGFDVIECDDLDEAIAVAAKHPMARWGCVEIRPIWPFD
jgi:hypothetical protein